MYSYYLSQFPESMYGVRPEKREKYVEDVIRGYKLMSQKKLLICGLARDIEKQLPKTISRVQFLSTLFKDVRILIFENDSSDKTVNLLKKWRDISNSRLALYTKKYNQKRFSDRSLSRSEQMAFCRNKLREFSFKYEDFPDFVALLDLDLEGGFSYNGIASTFGQYSKVKWDVVGSNSIFYRRQEEKIERLFYDTWAFRPLKQWYLYDKDLDKNNLLRFDRGEPLVRVHSCFGGLAFYTSKAWYCPGHEAYYSAVNDEGKNDCDHPTFHKMIWSYGYKRQFLNPSQITLYTEVFV